MVNGQEACTEILQEAVGGTREATDRLMPLVYNELRRLAAHYLRAERGQHLLQPTALVHEAYLKLVNLDRIDWRGKTHFFAVAATEMRRILVEHARRLSTIKRGAGSLTVSISTDLARPESPATDLLALDQSLGHLGQEHPRQARVAELRLFSGLQVKEAAYHLGVSERTVKADWRFARAWLINELGGNGA